ncbi:MAG: CRISPR-associated endonuclease Cas2 [Deltaproteobacteria bacterium]|nr:CRISPR-associated endonuclease Cas2 [Deltaproteobacteria bacterium]
MWVITMFDLPTDTKAARKAYHDFREALLDDGFVMLQFSVYARHCPSEENAVVHENRVKTFLPDDGEVRVLKITDKQFERMRVFHGKMRKATEKPPEQISFF